jgi:hypothetical protein
LGAEVIYYEGEDSTVTQILECLEALEVRQLGVVRALELLTEHVEVLNVTIGDMFDTH